MLSSILFMVPLIVVVVHICTDTRMDQSKRRGELIQWLANNHAASEVSAIRSLHNVSKLFFWVLMDLDGAANQFWKIQWDPGGCMLTLCSSEKRWTTPLHCYEQLQRLSLRLDCAFRIWLVAWTMDSLEFSMGHRHIPFQGGRNVTRAALSDHVQVSHDYYITFVNQIPVGYDYCLHQAYYFDTICSDIIYYHENYHCDSSKTTDVHMPWDPGKLVLCYHLKLRLGDKPNFKEGGMLGTYSTHTRTQAGLLCHDMGLAQAASGVLQVPGRRHRPRHPVGSERHGGGPFSPTSALISPIPFMLVHLVSRLSTKSL